jgi:hypothetical protein
MRHTRKGIGGSNPPLSATKQLKDIESLAPVSAGSLAAIEREVPIATPPLYAGPWDSIGKVRFLTQRRRWEGPLSGAEATSASDPIRTFQSLLRGQIAKCRRSGPARPRSG